MKDVLSKEQFVRVMNEIKKTRGFEDALFDFAWKHIECTGGITLPTATDTTIDLLAFIFDDKESWIDYYIYELDCGKSYHQGIIHDDNGNDLPLATPEDLYNLLIKEMEDK